MTVCLLLLALPAAVVAVGSVAELSMNTFHDFVKSATSVVLFCSPTLPRCAQHRSDWVEAARLSEFASFGIVDVKKNSGLARIFSVQQPPAVLIFRDGVLVERYIGSKQPVDVATYADQVARAHRVAPVAAAPGADDGVLRLSPDDIDARAFDELLAKSPTVLVAFTTHDCSHCRRLVPQLAMAAQVLKRERSRGRVAQVDCDSLLGRDLCSEFELAAFPALLLFRFGKPEHSFTGARTAEAIAEHVRQYSWRTEL